ncbi:OmpA family protein [Vibrio crassostreae]|uniref:OmpA family protein n=1 Tax=Vibrio crassostreae TaxID=246167 RepID=UPI00062FA52E|nr:OmpA family protein [Vibrio crassostreae]TCO05909.1 OOP family OmpA-OmpF porin [Vibrio crassostreae]TCT50221.1 OOP family OmpA-OmpF porin [Vibrio crassostreae]TCT63162.1 OOP family OmpA-OmpF porin [Vibrio crassostreae]TCT75331.1 OOP family OmpA-OmpF porin [Vibrio crassostreae]TCT94244.1 OOP family OmpA-OmpF porin [Vibrio crassostreae]
MKLAFPYLFAVIGVALGTPVQAELSSPSGDADLTSETASSLPPYQNGHFYLGGRVGWTAYQDACGDDALDCTDDTMGFGAYGGYQFNHWFALEGGITSYGSPSAHYNAGKVGADVYGGEIAMKLSLPLTERWDVFTRLGGAYQSIEKDFSPMPDDIDSHQWNVMASVGMSYRLSQRWSLRGEYQFIDGIGDNDVDQADLHFTSLGLTYHFGQLAPVVNRPPTTETPPVVPPRYVTVDKPLSLNAESLFGFDSSKLQSHASLDLLVDQLQSYPDDTIRIEGHTDASGREDYNQRLSERRAQTVANYLTDNGIDTSRLTVISMGESHPVAPNDTKEGRAMNRRVEVLFDTTIHETQQVIDNTPTMNESTEGK